MAGRVSGHSLRVGSAQSLAAAGAGLVELQEAGDWQAPTMPAHYARHQFAAPRPAVLPAFKGRPSTTRLPAYPCPGRVLS